MTPGSKWRHYKGGIYKLLGCCRLEATLVPHVVYKLWEDGDDHGVWWSRPLSEWDEEVETMPSKDGINRVRRFTEVVP